jgi:hypothetical protein
MLSGLTTVLELGLDEPLVDSEVAFHESLPAEGARMDAYVQSPMVMNGPADLGHATLRRNCWSQGLHANLSPL